MQMKQDTRTLPQGSLFDAVRDGFKFVTARARHVNIAYDRLESYAGLLSSTPLQNVLDDDHHYHGDAESTAAYILTLDAVNFGSGYAPDMEGEGWKMIDGSIYYTLSTMLKKNFDEKGPPASRALMAITADDCAALFGINAGGKAGAEFSGLCAASLRDLGRAVENTAHGSFLDFIGCARGSAENMVRILLQLPR
jgi:hypothetical protein